MSDRSFAFLSTSSLEPDYESYENVKSYSGTYFNKRGDLLPDETPDPFKASKKLEQLAQQPAPAFQDRRPVTTG
jgi:hypothetical protein